MSRLTAAFADIVNRMNPDAQRCALGDSIKETQDYAPVAIDYTVAVDASGAGLVAFTAPFAMKIRDIIVRAKATSGAATLTPGNGANAMCTAIVCATDGVVSHMAAGATAANAYTTLAAGDTVKLVASAADVRADVTFLGVRI